MIGQRVRRREDPRFITGQGNYVDDLELAGGAVPGRGRAGMHTVFD